MRPPLLRRSRATLPQPDGRVRSLFFTNIWLYGAALVLLLGMATGRQALTLLGLLVLITAGVARAWNRVALRGIAYTRALSATRVFPGEVVTLSLCLTNRKLLPVPLLSIEDELTVGLRPLDRDSMPSGNPGHQILRIVTSVRPYERVTWHVRLLCATRGLHTFGPATLRAGDLFGFFANRLRLPAGSTLLVYPRVLPLADLGFPPRRPFGELRVARHLLTDPTRTVGVRDYRPEDPFRAIHWKATARQGTLQVRVHEPTTALQLGVFVNLDTFEHYWEGLDVNATEIAIAVGASIAAWADANRYAVGVYANGIVAGSDQPLRVPPGRDPAQLAHILEGLAKLTPFSTVNFARILRAEAPRFPWGSTFAVVTPLLPEALTAVVADLLAAGHRVVFVPLADCAAPDLRGLIVRRVNEAAFSPEHAAAEPAATPVAPAE